jgi:hypothetical protein
LRGEISFWRAPWRSIAASRPRDPAPDKSEEGAVAAALSRRRAGAADYTWPATSTR